MALATPLSPPTQVLLRVSPVRISVIVSGDFTRW